MYQKCAALLGLLIIASAGSSKASANDCDDLIGRHMAGEAMLAAQFVALAEKAGMAPSEINATLKKISENSAIEEFWITDPDGHAYLTNTGLDFTFGPDAAKQPQASPFRALLDGRQKIVIQEPRKREIDNRIFKYVGVAGVDKPRIVQVGVSDKNLPVCK